MAIILRLDRMMADRKNKLKRTIRKRLVLQMSTYPKLRPER